MAKFCFCNQPVWGKGFCKSHQHLRPDFDRRSIAQKAMDKNKEKIAVRSLITYERQEGILDNTQELVLDLDRVVSRYIRLRDMGKDHKIECYCCGKKVDWKKAHCMHFINRQHMATRFMILNLHSGCYECNVEKRGNLEVYAEKLEKETPDVVEWLQEQSRTINNASQSELKELLFDFQQKLHLVETKLK
jgi:hypothetical protein